MYGPSACWRWPPDSNETEMFFFQPLDFSIFLHFHFLQAAALPRGAKVEIEAVAVVGDIHTVE